MWETFVDFDICHQMVSMRKLYYVTLTYFFEGQQFLICCKNVYISDTVRASAKMPRTTVIDLDICQCDIYT